VTRYLNFLYILTLLSISALGQTPAGDNKADPEAWKLLGETVKTRYYFTKAFTGFETDVVVNDNGKIAKGVLRYDVDKGADLQIKGLDEKETWPLEMAINIIGHRRRPDFDKGDGRNPITFADEDRSPAGRRLALNDAMKSFYRIRSGRVTEVDRTVGDEHFTISIIEELPAGNGMYLPRYFTVTYFDAKSGAIRRTQSFSDEYTKIGEVWFPAARRVIWAENGRTITRIIEFHNPSIKFQNK